MRSTFAVSILLLALSDLAMAGQIYKWVDSQGVTHFDAQPPSGVQATPVQGAKPVTAREATPNNAATKAGGDAEQRRIDAAVKSRIADEETRHRQFCTTARTNLAQLNNNPRIRQEMNGELRRLTQEERQAKINEVRGIIDTQCK
jgi:hypothetical protein